MTLTQDRFVPFHYRNFRLLFVATTLSIVGYILQSTALGWELYERTRDPLVLGNVGLAGFLPVLLLALPAGHLADRFDRQRVTVISRLFEIVGDLGLVYLSWTQGPIPLIFACILIHSSARTLGGAAYGAFLPNSVPASVFGRAVTWQSTAFQLAAMIAPAASGLLIARFASPTVAGPVNAGATLSYLIAAGLSTVAVICTALLTIPSPPSRHQAATWHDVLAGVRFVFQERLILSAITLDLFAVLFGGAVALLPVFAKDILQVGADGFGWLRAAPAIGATLMAVCLTAMPPIRRAGVTLLWVVAGFGVATIVFGLSRNFWLSLVALAFVGATDQVSVVIRSVLVPVRTPDAMRGRVNAVERVFVSSSNELGAWESGVTAAIFGPILSVIGGGVGTLIVVALVARFFPELRALHDLHPPAEVEDAP
ncbi:MAG: MFS transporter [Anaerolineae bacterium]|nr:MFS transporter [Anaerolineae bacterium]